MSLENLLCKAVEEWSFGYKLLKVDNDGLVE